MRDWPCIPHRRARRNESHWLGRRTLDIRPYYRQTLQQKITLNDLKNNIYSVHE